MGNYLAGSFGYWVIFGRQANSINEMHVASRSRSTNQPTNRRWPTDRHTGVHDGCMGENMAGSIPRPIMSSLCSPFLPYCIKP